MIQRRPSAAKRFVDWLGFRISRSVHVDGLWVGVFAGEREDEVLSRLCDALLLIKTHDQYRYKRVLREVRRLWGHMLPGSTAVWDDRTKACVVDYRFILASPLELIASAIVHESTHARLMNHGIGYTERLRYGVEMICLRQELGFAMKLPDGAELRNGIESLLTLEPDHWTDEAFKQRYDLGMLEATRHLKIPDWVVKVGQNIRKLRRRRPR